MIDLAYHLERLGLEQYLDAFVGEGFDTWETLLDIQESDLDALNVKLGHRRKLQRAILDYRGVSSDRLLGSPAREAPGDPSRPGEGSTGQAGQREGGVPPPTETKRKYRRHPKPDENAPEKPPSAYVLFSNRIREEVKAENLSFTEIAKLVGDRWQKLEPAQKEPYDSQAANLKEKYNLELSAYKKTDACKEYAQYLADFKAKHGQGPSTETKRPKLDPQSSGGSLSAASLEVIDATAPAPVHVRGGSIGSVSAASQAGTLPSPALPQQGGTASLPNLIPPTVHSGVAIPRPTSPSSAQFGYERRSLKQHSTQSSASEDSGTVRGDLYDTLSRTATLSLSTPPAITPPLPPRTLSSGRSEHGTLETFGWPPRNPAGIGQHSSAPSPHPLPLNLSSPAITGDSRRERVPDAHRSAAAPSAPPSSGFSHSLPLPSLFAPERMSDLARVQVQRTLPPLRHHPISAPPSGFSGTYSGTLTNTAQSGGPRRPSQHLQDLSPRPLERHENENDAASTLAGLANRPGQDNVHPSDRRT